MIKPEIETPPERWYEFRKKPVVIKAWRTDEERTIETLEGTMTASAGDWIIQGVEGEFYPCKDEIFRKTYEREYK